ncbi:MAG: hypothetical protein AMJ42_00750 [Deltaproteobacteria bacterium DG_8]|nr:MAG: hypothetical protein AMJ42_00750 [Deltaproteobacteria bacterium DG_8]
MINLTTYLRNPKIYLIIIAMLFVLHSLHFSFVCDDAFISFRYAKNFINGHGLVWNIGERPVEGYTNFLWIIVISLFMKVGFEPVIVSKVLGIFFGLCCIILVYLFSELIFQRKSFLNLVAPAILACCGPFAAWSTGGLETQMFTFFILAAVTMYLYEIQNDKITSFSAVLFVLASLTRPEGILIFGVTCLHNFFYLLFSKRSPFCRKTIIWFLTFIIIYGVYFYWRFNYYGFIFPNAYYAKTGGGVYQLFRGFRYLARFILFYKWPLLIGLSLLTLLKPLRSSIIYLLMLIISFSAYIVYIGGDFLGMFRFFVPILPLMAILVQEGVIALCQWLIRIIHPTFVKTSVITLCSFTFILILVKGLTFSFKGQPYERILYHKRVTEGQSAKGRWLHRHASPDESLAAFGIGAISYYSELNTIDRLGITDIHIAHTKMHHMGKGLPGHEKRNFSYVLMKKPNYLSGPVVFPKRSKYKPTNKEIKRFKQLYKPFYINEPNLKFSLYKLKEDQ